MPEFIATGRLTLDGVTFLIDATDEANAKEKAKLGGYTSYFTNGAGAVDWEIMASTLKAVD